MAKAGDVIENPQSGERVVFRTTTAESNGRLLGFDFYLRKGAKQPMSHRHMKQESRFKIVSGLMGATLGGGKPRIFKPGELLIVPTGTHHQVWNAGEDELHAYVEFEPANDFEAFLETLFGLMRDDKLNGHGLFPRPLLQATLLSAQNDLFVSGIPVPLQRAAYAVMAPLARKRGYRLRYPEYNGNGVGANGNGAAAAAG